MEESCIARWKYVTASQLLSEPRLAGALWPKRIVDWTQTKEQVSGKAGA